MYPYSVLNEIEQLRRNKAYGRMLADEWRTANSSRSDRGVDASPTGPVRRALRVARRATGSILIELGRRMLPVETGQRPRAARQADGGC